MKRLEMFFSTTDTLTGDRFTEHHVRHLIAGFADLYSIEAYTLNKAVTGYWMGSEEDSYNLSIICFSEQDYNKILKFMVQLSSAIEDIYNQDEILITSTDIQVLQEL